MGFYSLKLYCFISLRILLSMLKDKYTFLGIYKVLYGFGEPFVVFWEQELVGFYSLEI